MANAESLRRRIMVAHALCATAEAEIRRGRKELALQSVADIRRIVAEMSLLVSQPSLAPGEARELSDLLATLQDRVHKTATGL